MRRLQLLLPGLTAAEILGSWTISALTRQCNPQDTSCTYTLTLTTSYLTHPDNSRNDDITTCSFTVLSPASTTSLIAAEPSSSSVQQPPARVSQPEQAELEASAASKSDFVSVACGETGRYRLNGGWELDVDVPGDEFLTLVVTDMARDAYAFFGFREAELTSSGESGAVKIGDAYHVGSFGFVDVDAGADGKDEGVETIASGGVVDGMVRKRGGRQGMGIKKSRGLDVGQLNVRTGVNGAEKGAAEDEKEWQVKGLTWSPNADQNTTDWAFSILDIQTGQEANCSQAIPNSGPTASFYGMPCGQDAKANFRISWGYNSAVDSAVMTVCYAPNGTTAWFGYEQVSRNQQLGDSKQEPVYWTGCA